MASQTSSNVLVAIKRETTTGVIPAVATGASVLRMIDSPGLKLHRAPIHSVEKRDDGLKSMGRLGFKTVDGSYNSELSVGGAHDILLEAIMRSAWVASSTVLTCDGGGIYTSLETTASTITLAGSASFLTLGIKKGDIVRLGATTANDSVNCLVVGVAANVLTLAGSPLAIQSADTNATLTKLKKVISATTPTRYSHAVEQYDQDIDLSEVFLGCRLVGVKLSFKPGAFVQVTWTFLGMDRTLFVTGTSPFYTSPSVSTGDGLIADDSSIYKNGAVVATFTGFDLDITINAAGVATIGSLVGPDIFDNDVDVKGSITSIRSDFANLILYDAETEFEIGIMLHEAGAVPQGAIAFWIPRVKIAYVDAPAGGGDGAKIETLELMIGAHVAASGEDAGIMTISSSGA